MEELESQIAKIQLGGNKTSTSFVFVLAEKSAAGPELYVVAELPLFNPAAEESCKNICLAISSCLRRAYKLSDNPGSFENAISQINEELGKLASMGQAQWIDKLNCVLGVKQDKEFNIATCGKISAYLLRNGEFTDISCSPAQSHPLKIFENYASGKIRLHDLLILSTSQLFNYLSMDRLSGIFGKTNFLTAAQTIIELLKENAEPQVSFGVLLNLQVLLGQVPDEEVDLENYIVEKPAGTQNFPAKVLNYLKTAFVVNKSPARIPQTGLPKVSLGQRLKQWSGETKSLVVKSRGWWQSAKTSAKTVKNTVNVENIRGLSVQKKFFLISIVILFAAFVVNVSVTEHYKKIQSQITSTATKLKNIQTLLSNAQSSLLYKDNASAGTFLAQAKTQMPQAQTVPAADKTLYSEAQAQYQQTIQQAEKVVTATVSNLGSLGAASALIKLPNYLGVRVNQSIISYNKQNGQIEDGALTAGLQITDSVFVANTTAIIYNGGNLYNWDFSLGKTGAAYSQAVPAAAAFGGMAEYPVNNRVYCLNKQTASITSFLISNNGFAKPVASVQDSSLSQGQDLAIGIDGSIYVLTSSGIEKFQYGRLANFTMPYLIPAFSGEGKLYTQKTFQYLYVLDAGNNRILVLAKDGTLMETLESDQFTKLTDIEVDEPNKTLYALNDGSLLKVTLP